MLEEVLSGYGPIFEVWFDGANGEGPNGKRQVYDWPAFHATVKRLQPDAVIFSDGGPGVRWVGNERGQGSLTSWSLLDRDALRARHAVQRRSRRRIAPGTDWVPPECDVSIRPGWFYRASEDARVKPAATLFRLYEQSVGRNCQLLLNVPPDTRGLIADPDAERARRHAPRDRRGVRRQPRARGHASAPMRLRPGFEPAQALDGSPTRSGRRPRSRTTRPPDSRPARAGHLRSRRAAGAHRARPARRRVRGRGDDRWAVDAHRCRFDDRIQADPDGAGRPRPTACASRSTRRAHARSRRDRAAPIAARQVSRPRPRTLVRSPDSGQRKPCRLPPAPRPQASATTDTKPGNPTHEPPHVSRNASSHPRPRAPFSRSTHHAGGPRRRAAPDGPSPLVLWFNSRRVEVGRGAAGWQWPPRRDGVWRASGSSGCS